MTDDVHHSVRDPARLSALRRLAILDTPAEEGFDRLTRLASRMLKAPVALVSLVDEDRQWFKSAIGLPEPWASRRQTPLSHSFCQHVVASCSPLVVEDAREHPVLCTNLAIPDLNVVAYAGIPLVGPGGDVLGSFCVIDGAPRRWAPDEVLLLQDLAASVMTELDLRATAIERSELITQLREANRRKDEFLAMLSHELRNPLSAITLAVERLKRREVPADSLARARSVLEHQTRYMARLIDDLLDVSRIIHGRIVLQRQPVDLRAVVGRAVEVAHAGAEAAGLTLHVTQPERPVEVEGDPTRLEQVVSNLLHNALKYTERGGRVAVSLALEEAQAVLRVQDNGMGISPELLPHVFELFVQGKRAAAHAQAGLGIGLTLVSRLVELHGGRVSARSAGLQRGSQFEVRLPLRAPGASHALPGAAPPQEASVRRTRVLVVDDNLDAAALLGEGLELLGHDVRVVHDGPGALDAAQTFLPDVVLLDVGLPGMDGYEVARRLRRDPQLGGALLVAVTGYGQEQDREASRSAGFDRHLVKPVELDTLQQLIARHAPGAALARAV